MANVPSKNLIKAVQEQTKKDIADKKQAQKKEGKGFKLPSGGGPGVIPEQVWKRLTRKKR